MKSLKRSLLVLLTLALFALPALLGFSAFDAFLKIDGVDGESTDEKHKGWIEIESFNFGMTRSGAGMTGGSTNRAGVADIQIVKALDKASPRLAEALGSKAVLPRLELSVRRVGAANESYYTVVMQNVLVSSLQLGGSSTNEAPPKEEVTFNFGMIQWIYRPLDAAGLPSGEPVVGMWDLTVSPP